MKRFVIAIVLLLCVVFGDFFIACVSVRAIEETRDALSLCSEKTVPSEVKTALKKWEKNKKVLHMTMFHDEFSEIEKKMISLRYLSVFPDSDEIAKISKECAMMLDNKRSYFYVSLENIF